MNYYEYQAMAKADGQITFDPEWGQGRSIFGGLTGALVLSYITGTSDLSGRDLRTLNIHFCGATIAGEPCEFRHRILSEGRSVTQIEGQLLQNGEVKTAVIACFAIRRDSDLVVSAPQRTFESSPDRAIKMPFIQGHMPEFIRHFDLRYTSKGLPFSGTDETTISGWMRLKQTPERFTDPIIVTLIDAWPPAILPMLTERAPSSTITWNMEFIQPIASLEADDFLYYECTATQASAGYAHSEGKVYHPNGQLLALNRQLVGVYDKK